MTTEEKNQKNTPQITDDEILNSTTITRFINSKPSPETRSKYRSFLLHYFKAINKNPDAYFIEDYEYLDGSQKKILAKQYRHDLEDYKIKLLNEPNKYGGNNAPASNRTRLSCISSLFTFNETQLPKAFWENYKTFKNVVTGKKEHLSAEKIAKILQHTDIQGRSFFVIMATSGSRISAVRKLKRKDIELERIYPKIVFRGKNAKNKRTKIKRTTPEGKRILEEYFKLYNFQPENYIFPATRTVNGKWIKDYTKPMSKQNVTEKWKNALKKAKLLKKDEATRQVTIVPHELKKFFRTQSAKINENLSKYFSEHNELDARYVNLSDEELDDEYAKICKNLLIYEKPYDVDKRIIEHQKKIADLEGHLKVAKDSAKINQELNEKLEQMNQHHEKRFKDIEENVKQSFNTKSNEFNLAYKLMEMVVNNNKDLNTDQKKNYLDQRPLVEEFFKIWVDQTTKNKKTLLESANELMKNPDNIDKILATIKQKK